MILSRSPFRVTLGGGGTDLPSYYTKHGGFLLAMGIDKYMYVGINPPLLDRKIRVQYTRSETADHPDQIQHELVREALKRNEIYSRMEISSIADLPSGTGLGSSGCFLVGLLNSLRSYRRNSCSPQDLAEEACSIELDVLKKGIGKQDQYMAAFGGLTVLEIARDGAVTVRQLEIDRSGLADFVANTHMYWTGVRRSAPVVLKDQDIAMKSESSPSHEAVQECLHGIKETGYGILEAIESQNFDEFGRLMDVHWSYKKRMSAKISIPGIGELYEEIKTRFGVLGGKVSGAGGGGCFVVYAPEKHTELTRFMEGHGLVRMHYQVEIEGSKIICNSSGSSRNLDHSPTEEH